MVTIILQRVAETVPLQPCPLETSVAAFCMITSARMLVRVEVPTVTMQRTAAEALIVQPSRKTSTIIVSPTLQWRQTTRSPEAMCRRRRRRKIPPRPPSRQQSA